MVPAQQLAAAYAREPGKMRAGRRGEWNQGLLAGSKDGALMERIAAAFQGAGADNAGPLLAAMLYFFPHQLGRFIAPERVPGFLREDYFRYLVTGPDLFTRGREADAYRQYLEGMLGFFLDRAANDPAAPEAKLDAERAAVGASIVPAYFTEANLRDLMVKRPAHRAGFAIQGFSRGCRVSAA